MSQAKRNLWWAFSLLVVFGIHALVFVWALFWHATVEPIELPPAAMIELEPLPARPRAHSAAAPRVEPEPDPLPKLAEAPKPTIAIAPKPKQAEAAETQAPEPKPEQKPQEQESTKETVSAPTTAAPSDAKPAAPQQSMASAPSQARETWQSKLMAHLARFKSTRKTHVAGTSRRVNRLRFTVDGEGKVTAYSITGKSGSASLDRATLEMIRRAQPLPPLRRSC